jgi:hypothetical protein
MIGSILDSRFSSPGPFKKIALLESTIEQGSFITKRRNEVCFLVSLALTRHDSMIHRSIFHTFRILFCRDLAVFSLESTLRNTIVVIGIADAVRGDLPVRVEAFHVSPMLVIIIHIKKYVGRMMSPCNAYRNTIICRRFSASKSPRSRTAGAHFLASVDAASRRRIVRFPPSRARARAYSIMPLFFVARLKLCAIRYVSIDRRLRRVYRSVHARFLRLPNNRSLFVPRTPRNNLLGFLYLCI